MKESCWISDDWNRQREFMAVILPSRLVRLHRAYSFVSHARDLERRPVRSMNGVDIRGDFKQLKLQQKCKYAYFSAFTIAIDAMRERTAVSLNSNVTKKYNCARRSEKFHRTALKLFIR